MEVLLAYMKENLSFARGDEPVQLSSIHWETVTIKLNGLEGAQKLALEWAKVNYGRRIRKSHLRSL